MAVEIERKFLVRDGWRELAVSSLSGKLYRQGYLTSVRDGSRCTVRVRVAGEQGYLTIKGATSDISRAEYEYAIPVTEATELLDTLCQCPLIEKTRYRVPYQSLQDAGQKLSPTLVWEIDEFAGENQGLVVAEIELPAADHPLELPDWIGAEVSGDPRYFNASLVEYPFCEWK
jgi:adenylate cyclase